MRFHVLGALEVLDGAGPVTVRRGRPRALLHLLLQQRRVVVPVEVVADRLWPEGQPADAGNGVHQLVSYLRRALGDEGRRCLVTSPTGYMLDVADDDVDAHVFESLVQVALDALASPGSDGPARALAAAEQAAPLWRGEPYAESATYSWVAGDVQRLKDSYLLLQEARLEALLRLGRHRQAILEATSLVSAYPLREQLHGHLSLALYRSGRQSEALEVHRDLRTLLSEELGIDPSAPLQALEDQILHQDPALDWRPSGEVTQVVPEPRPEEPESTGASSAAPDQPPPDHAGPLVGRGTEVGQLQDLVGHHRLVTVVGPPGVGKSRLAAALATGVPAAHRWFLDLSDVDDKDATAGTLMTRLRLDGSPDDGLQRVAAALDPGLLVLDGCEAATRSIRSLISGLLDSTGGLRILVASRRPLQLGGEVVYRLQPLGLGRDAAGAVAPATQLFLHAAQASTGRAWDGPEDLPHVEAIVAALDGLPLAVELAAANVDVLGLPALRGRVTQLDYLVQPGPDGPARHQSLRAAIESSVDLLEGPDRTFLARLGVFPGSFDLEAAGAVTASRPGEAYQHVASLVRQSLVVTDGEAGYRLLAPIRDYAVDLLDGQPDADDVRDRHARHVAAQVAPVAGDFHRRTQKDVVRQLQGRLSDARVAMEWSLSRHDLATAAEIASAYAWFWNLLGMTEEGVDRLLEVRRLVEASDESWSSTPAYATLLRNLGLLANPAGRLGLAEEACAQAAALCRALEDWDGAARALLTQGIALWARGAYAEAAQAHEEAAALHERGASDWSHVSALALRARTSLDAGEPDTAARIERALEASRNAGDKHMVGLTALIEARWAATTGSHELAQMAAERALEVWRAISYREGEIGALNQLGRLALDRGRRDQAEPLLLEALRTAVAAGHPGGQCEAVESLAALAAAGSRHEHAYFLSCVAALERRRIGAPVPAADAARLRELEETSTSVLGQTAEMVRSRAQVVDFADVRRELLAG